LKQSLFAKYPDYKDKIMPKILIVDDCELQTTLISLVLSSKGYEVEVGTDGQTGLNLALTNNFDLIITDLNLGDMSGIDLARQLKQSKPTTPILLATTKDALEGLDPGQINGVLDYLCDKDLNALLTRIEIALHKLRRQSV
jgi:DNA-binding response OmpR family regulator